MSAEPATVRQYGVEIVFECWEDGDDFEDSTFWMIQAATPAEARAKAEAHGRSKYGDNYIGVEDPFEIK